MLNIRAEVVRSCLVRGQRAAFVVANRSNDETRRTELVTRDMFEATVDRYARRLEVGTTNRWCAGQSIPTDNKRTYLLGAGA